MPYRCKTYLSNRVFDNHDTIIDAPCDAWNQNIEMSWNFMFMGMREWAHSGRAQ